MKLTVPAELAAKLAEFEDQFAAGNQTLELVANAIDTANNANRADLIKPWAERAFQIDPTCWFALHYMGLAHEILGEHDRAVHYFSELYHHHPSIDPLQLRKTQALIRNREMDAAEQLLLAALAFFDAGQTCQTLFYSSEEYRMRAEGIAERFYLMNGDHIGHHYRVTHIDGFYMLPEVPVWSGELLADKNLFISHGLGYGDQLLFFAIIPMIAQHCGQITLSVDSHLVNLLAPSLPNVRIISSDRPLTPTPAPQWLVDTFAGDLPDVQMSMLHLPLLFERLYPQQALEFSPFLTPPDMPTSKFPEEIAFLRQHNSQRKLIGLAWSRGQQFIPDIVGGEGASHAARTSITTDAILSLINDPELNEFAHFVALHPANEPRSWPDPFPSNLSVPTIRSGCYEETAQWMNGLDLILTVDMVCATLAALLDCPTWLMMSYEGEWRWGQTGDRSIWVPNARIFRQPKLNDWAGMFAEMKPELLAWLKSSLLAGALF